MIDTAFRKLTGYTMGEARKAIQAVVMYAWPMVAVVGINPSIVSPETLIVILLGGFFVFQQVFGTPNDEGFADLIEEVSVILDSDNDALPDDEPGTLSAPEGTS